MNGKRGLTSHTGYTHSGWAALILGQARAYYGRWVLTMWLLLILLGHWMPPPAQPVHIAHSDRSEF